MSWKSEHGLDYEVPGIIDYMVELGILEDVSWHNDTMPRFQIKDPKNEERGVTIWVDHPIGSERETGPEGKRFLVQDGEFMSDTPYELEVDDLEKAVTTALRRGEKYQKKDRRVNWPGLVKEWRESLVS